MTGLADRCARSADARLLEAWVSEFHVRAAASADDASGFDADDGPSKPR